MEYTDEKINEIANDFFKNNRFEKAKIAGFKAGFKKALSLCAVSGSLPPGVAKEAAFLLQIDGVTHCPKWVEGVGDCRMLDCLFCRKQRCVEALEELKRQ